MNNKIIIHTDGGARGNPGPAGIGAVLQQDNGKVIFEISEYIGETTNNQAEYRAVIAALEKAKSLALKEIELYADSELVIKQLKREYKVKHPDLAPLYLKCFNLTQSFDKIKFIHIPRELNKAADALVNEALDKHLR